MLQFVWSAAGTGIVGTDQRAQSVTGWIPITLTSTGVLTLKALCFGLMDERRYPKRNGVRVSFAADDHNFPPALSGDDQASPVSEVSPQCGIAE